jgi:hypothetical protein
MSRTLIHLGAGGVLCFALLLVAAGPITGLIAVGLVVLFVAMTCLGPELVGTGFLGLAFATAPMYKGLAPEGSTVTPTDLCLALGLMLLLPRMTHGKISMPSSYLLAVAVIGTTGIIGAFVSVAPVASLFSLVLWLATIVALPLAVDLIQPSRRMINGLALMYVAGHVFSTFYGLATGRAADGGRYYGLANHPNYYAEAGVVATALLLYLWASTTRRWLVLLSAPICIYSVYISGSRAGFLTLAVLIAAIPVVERSAIKGYLLAFGAAIGGAVLFTGLSSGPSGGALARLTGQGSALGSNQEREQNLRQGWGRFLDHPLSGSGLVDLFTVHNNYLEVAIATGVFGFIAFLVAVGKLGAPLIGTDDLRRLCYPVLVYALFSATTPGLYDRTFWVPIALSILAVGSHARTRAARRSTAGASADPDIVLSGALVRGRSR